MKGKKIIVPLLLAGVATSSVVANVQQQVVEVSAVDKSEWSVLGDNIEVVGGFDIREDGKVYLPTVNTADPDNYEYKVTKGDRIIDVEEDAEGFYFEAIYEGYYNVSISTKTENGVKTEIENLSVWIEGQDATINLPVNSKYVIPAKVPASLAGCAQEFLYIPVPTVNIEDDEKPTTIDKLTAGQQLSARLITPSNSKGIKLTSDNTNSFYSVAKTDLANNGTYTIVYEYRTGTDSDDDGYLDKVVSRLESNFQVVSSYNLDNIKLTMSLLDSIPTSACVNREVELPKIKVTETASSMDAINSYVKVTIKNLTTKEILDDKLFNYNDYTFVPTTEGEYLVTYTAAIDLFGKTTAEVTPDQTIKVSDTESAKVMASYDYTVENGVITKVNNAPVAEEKEGETVVKTQAQVAEERLTEKTLESHIPTVVRLKDNNGKKEVAVKIPALFATDNFDKYADLTLQRSYRAPNGAVVTIDTPVNETATITLSSVGIYDFRYRAIDKAGNPAGYQEYEVEVKDYNQDMEADETRVDLSVGVKTISDKDQFLKFSKPTVDDTYDKTVSTQTFYKPVTQAEGQEVVVGDAIEIEEIAKLNADGKFVVDVEKLLAKHADLKEIRIFAEAYIDGYLVDTRESFKSADVTMKDGFIVVATSENANVVKVVDSSDDTAAPVIDSTMVANWNANLLAINDTQYKKDKDGNQVLDENDQPIVERESILLDGAVAINDEGYALNGESEVIQIKVGDKFISQSAFDQGNDTLYLPNMVFTDTFDDNMKIKVTIRNDAGDVVSKVDTEKVKVEYKNVAAQAEPEDFRYVYTVSGASFNLSNYGLYTVTYQATDIAGNISIQTFGIRVNDKTAPTIVLDNISAFDGENGYIEVGKKFEVPQGKFVKNNKTMDNVPEWEIYKVSKGAKYETIGETGFVPLSNGTFTIRYTGTDETGNEATLENSLFTVTAKDTTKPVLTLNESYYLDKDIDEWKTDTDAVDYMTIYIPTATAYDGRFKDEETGKVVDYGYGRDLEVSYTVTGPAGTSPEIISVKDELTGKDRYDIKAFRATKQGAYTVTYSATDGINTPTTKPITIYVGDCDKPELEWKDQKNDLKTEVKFGGEFKLDYEAFILKDNKTTFTPETIKDKKLLQVTMVDPDGNAVKNEGTDYVNFICSNMNKVGSYTLKVVLKDEVGNTQTASYAIVVPEEEVEEETISPVLGTVLVVLSVVVLAGVVIYFVASSRKKGGKKAKKATKK